MAELIEYSFLYGDFSLLREIALGETVGEKVEDTIVAATFFDDVPF